MSTPARSASSLADRAVKAAQKSGRGGAPKPVPIDVEMTHFAADIIFRTIYSEPMGARDARRFFAAFEVFQKIAYAHGMLKLSRFQTWILPGFYRARLAANIIREILARPLRRRLKAVRAGQPTPDNDILASLLTTTDPVTGTRFDDNELLDQIAMLFLAGHETSATAASWALYLLAHCPHIQERCHAEAVEVYGDRAPRFEDMKRLEHTSTSSARRCGCIRPWPCWPATPPPTSGC